MTCLPESAPGLSGPWLLWLDLWAQLLWLDLWAQSARNPGAAAVRQKFHERWQETIRDLVRAGQGDSEFGSIDADDFALTLSALLDGLAVPIALQDLDVTPTRAFELTIRFTAGQLGLEWRVPGRACSRGSGPGAGAAHYWQLGGGRYP